MTDHAGGKSKINDKFHDMFSKYSAIANDFSKFVARRFISEYTKI